MPWRCMGKWRYSFTFLTSALDGSEWSVVLPGHFTPSERASGMHWRGGWVGPRATLDVVAKRDSLPLQGINLWSPTHRSHYTDWAPQSPAGNKWHSFLPWLTVARWGPNMLFAQYFKGSCYQHVLGSHKLSESFMPLFFYPHYSIFLLCMTNHAAPHIYHATAPIRWLQHLWRIILYIITFSMWNDNNF